MVKTKSGRENIVYWNVAHEPLLLTLNRGNLEKKESEPN